ncbi:MAG: hypothetical protein ACRCZB_05980 [Bacteroidales bacterium]
MENHEKSLLYANLLRAKVAELFDDENEYCIDKNELFEGDNLTHFIHALSNIMPCFVFQKFTGEDKTLLEFNHLSNALIFQYHGYKRVASNH